MFRRFSARRESRAARAQLPHIHFPGNTHYL